MKNYYKILEIETTAEQVDIKKAFRSLAKKYHPDRNKDNEEALRKFQDINEAYEVLGKEDSRKKYDESLRKSEERKNSFSQKRSEAKGSQNTGRVKKTGNTKVDFENLNSYFENFFGFSADSERINKDKLKKNKNPLDVSNMFNEFFKVKKK